MNIYHSTLSTFSTIFRRPLAIIDRYEKWRPYTDKQAWGLFKVAAYAEAVTWAALVISIIAKYSVNPPNTIPVSISGQLHGMVFIFYIVAVIAVYPTLRWPRWFMLLAGLASIPPFGTIIVEKWAAFRRRSNDLRLRREVTVKAMIIRDNKLLAVQPIDTVEWELPGGIVGPNKTTEQALSNQVLSITGIMPKIGRLGWIVESQLKNVQKMEMYFHIDNPTDFDLTAMKKFVATARLADEIEFKPLNVLQTSLPTGLNQKDITPKSSRDSMATKIVQINNRRN